MYNLNEMIETIKELGYNDSDAQARVCQDIVLKAISESSLNRNVTIKGGVVMRSLTQNVRRATQDMDIDFIRYSLSENSIDVFVKKLNSIEGLYIRTVGDIEELRQQDYHGKRVFVKITDDFGNVLESKIDLVQRCINFEVIGAWILCQRKAEEGGNAVALLTDNNEAMAQKAGAYYSKINATLY